MSGAVTIGLAFAAELFGPLILQVALSIYGMVGGPLLGLFICAMFIPMVNSWVNMILITGNIHLYKSHFVYCCEWAPGTISWGKGGNYLYMT